jgi:UPF0042 nucleotide-binding protein
VTQATDLSRGVDIIVITGMSGAGKSTAITALEDEGFYCIDNLPTLLVTRFVALYAAGSGPGTSKVALGLDLRDLAYGRQWPAVRRQIESDGHRVFMVFLDADDDVLLRRFSETRRAHPLGHDRPLSEAIAAEREALAPLRDKTSLVIDTSALTVHELKRRIRELVGGQAAGKQPLITIKSFGFKHGVAGDVDMLLDVRFLPNPYFDPTLRPMTGLDPAVASFVLERNDSRVFLDHVARLLEFLLPRYAAEGRSYLTLGVGCTGGQHRSVVLAERIARTLKEGGFNVAVRHRDINRR